MCIQMDHTLHIFGKKDNKRSNFSDKNWKNEEYKIKKKKKKKEEQFICQCMKSLKCT